MWNWTFQASIETQALPVDVWRLWEDAAGWPKWDEALEWCKLFGPFAEGTAGELKAKGWPPLKFLITSVEKNRGYSDETRMPLTIITFHHNLAILNSGKIRITHLIEARGLFAPLLRLTLRRQLKRGLRKALENLAKLARGI